ncbi:hypothetical protein [Psychrobacter sp. D2]|uniref:hypothetical protein n=1 Tax=Psychrobacter sp. D2 TaxID=2759702 RepID=UPI00216947F5|nr:hypothetical protein [Psychrobacter sp. D2]
MKTLPFTFIKSKPYFQAVSAIFLSLSLLIACKKTPEPETANETTTELATQTTPVTSNINAPMLPMILMPTRLLRIQNQM